jgi:hypothetical protein
VSAKPPISTSNANTVLLTILLAISGWTLVTLLDVKDTVTKTVVRVDNHDHEIGALLANDAQQSKDIIELRIRRAQQATATSTATQPH